MPGIARLKCHMDVIGPFLGFVQALTPDYALIVEKWVGPLNVQIPNGTALQPLVVFGVQGINVATVFMVTADQNIYLNYISPSALPVTLHSGGIHAFAGTDITNVYVNNNSGYTANLTYMIGGTA